VSVDVKTRSRAPTHTTYVPSPSPCVYRYVCACVCVCEYINVHTQLYVARYLNFITCPSRLKHHLLQQHNNTHYAQSLQQHALHTTATHTTHHLLQQHALRTATTRTTHTIYCNNTHYARALPLALALILALVFALALSLISQSVGVYVLTLTRFTLHNCTLTHCHTPTAPRQHPHTTLCCVRESWRHGVLNGPPQSPAQTDGNVCV